MKVRYVGKSFGVEGLTNGKIYKVLSIEGNMIRIIDDSGEDYLYSAVKPSCLEEPEKYGEWEIIEDNKEKELRKIVGKKYIK